VYYNFPYSYYLKHPSFQEARSEMLPQNVQTSSCEVPPILPPYFNKIYNFSTEFRKIPNIKLHQNPSSGSRVVPCGRTDEHDEANSRFQQFCERAQKYKSTYAMRLVLQYNVQMLLIYYIQLEF
jgi:hypothetical protein